MWQRHLVLLRTDWVGGRLVHLGIQVSKLAKSWQKLRRGSQIQLGFVQLVSETQSRDAKVREWSSLRKYNSVAWFRWNRAWLGEDLFRDRDAPRVTPGRLLREGQRIDSCRVQVLRCCHHVYLLGAPVPDIFRDSFIADLQPCPSVGS